eukprot:Sspe_Gene.20245::Locus_7428_Transcript_2_6_Confidence_0.250_Length_1184::g.20245::m.20245
MSRPLPPLLRVRVLVLPLPLLRSVLDLLLRLHREERRLLLLPRPLLPLLIRQLLLLLHLHLVLVRRHVEVRVRHRLQELVPRPIVSSSSSGRFRHASSSGSRSRPASPSGFHSIRSFTACTCCGVGSCPSVDRRQPSGSSSTRIRLSLSSLSFSQFIRFALSSSDSCFRYQSHASPAAAATAPQGASGTSRRASASPGSDAGSPTFSRYHASRFFSDGTVYVRRGVGFSP